MNISTSSEGEDMLRSGEKGHVRVNYADDGFGLILDLEAARSEVLGSSLSVQTKHLIKRILDASITGGDAYLGLCSAKELRKGRREFEDLEIALACKNRMTCRETGERIGKLEAVVYEVARLSTKQFKPAAPLLNTPGRSRVFAALKKYRRMFE